MDKVIISHSFFMEKCITMFNHLTFTRETTLHFHGGESKLTNLIFTNSSMSINFFESVDVALTNVQLRNITTKTKGRLFLVDSCLYTKFTNITITDSNIYQTLVTLKTLFVLFKHFHVFSTQGNDNTTSIVLQEAIEVTVTDFTLIGNNDFDVLLSNIQSAADFHGVNISNNTMRSGSTSYFLTLQNSKVSMQNATFSCNTYGPSNYTVPVVLDEKSSFQCRVCSMGRCKMQCSAGKEISNSALCVPCSPGTSTNNTLNCQKCKKGFYATGYGNSQCKLCEEGTYCNEEGCFSCAECDSDFFTSGKGAKECKKVTSLSIVLMVLLVVLLTSATIIITWKRCRSKESYNELRNVDNEADTAINNPDV